MLLSLLVGAAVAGTVTDGPQTRLLVEGAPGAESVCVVTGDSSVRLDPRDGHVLDMGAAPSSPSRDELTVVRVANGVALLDADGRPAAQVPVSSRAATFVNDTLWVLTETELQRYPWTEGRLGRATSVRVTAGAGAVGCGDHVCFVLGSLRWDPFLGTRWIEPWVDPEGPEGASLRWDLIGAVSGDFALRQVPTGTQVVDVASGHDVGPVIPRWASGGAVTADGTLALVVDADRTSLFEVATGQERWTLPVASTPDVLTPTAFTAERGRVLVDTATGRRAYTFQGGAPAAGTGWLIASLHSVEGEWWTRSRQPPGPATATLSGGDALPAWTPVLAPVPVRGEVADDPLRRARWTIGTGSPPDLHAGLPNLLAAASAERIRLEALTRALGAPAGVNPLGALVVLPVWPDRAGAPPEVASPEPLRPGRSVALPTRLELADGSRFRLPLQPSRAMLVVVGTDGSLPPPLTAAAHDPHVDVLWALSAPFEQRFPHGFNQPSTTLDPTSGPEALPALSWAPKVPGKQFEVVRFGAHVAREYGLPDPGALLVDGRGRLLARGSIEVVGEAIRGWGLGRLAPLLDTLWAYEGPEPVRRLAPLPDGGVAFLTEDTVGVLDADGTLRWTGPESSTRLGISGDSVVTSVEPEPVGDDGVMTVRNVRDGTTVWTATASVRATGRSWVLVQLPRFAPGYRPDTPTRLMATADGTTIRGLADVENPTAVWDQLWFDGPAGTRCGWDVAADLTLGCGSERRGSPPFLQRGSPSGPWETSEGGAASLVSDVPPVQDAGPIYGILDGAIVAWGTR